MASLIINTATYFLTFVAEIDPYSHYNFLFNMITYELLYQGMTPGSQMSPALRKTYSTGLLIKSKEKIPKKGT